jgi:hypothetical protein
LICSKTDGSDLVRIATAKNGRNYTLSVTEKEEIGFMAALDSHMYGSHFFKCFGKLFTVWVEYHSMVYNFGGCFYELLNVSKKAEDSDNIHLVGRIA